jgi:hypothetical protein
LSSAHGRELIEHHRKAYRKYWAWSDRIEARGMLGAPLRTAFGWQTVAGRMANQRSLRNFPSQANGAEMLRLACIALTEADIHVCASVHHAVLIEDREDRIDETVERARDIMRSASEVVLDGFEIRTEAKIVLFPDRYSDPRGVSMEDHLRSHGPIHAEGLTKSDPAKMTGWTCHFDTTVPSFCVCIL